MELKSLHFLCAVLLFTSVLNTLAVYQYDSPWSWSCEGTDESTRRCVKYETVESAVEDGSQMPLNQCKLTCNDDGPVWPLPTGVKSYGKQVSKFTFSQMSNVDVPANDVQIEDEIQTIFDLFLDHVEMCHPDYDFIMGAAPWTAPVDNDILSHQVQVAITVLEADEHLTLETDESYNLIISTTGAITNVDISAETFFGARHALESLSQIINFNEANNCLQIISEVNIQNDSPVFPYRGLIIDTARNFIPVVDIERTIDTMAANKLNSFHWHITDTNSVPIVLESQPEMNHYGVHNSREVYQTDDVRRIIEYGRVRGVRVVPEIDTPAHVGNGWQWGPQKGLGDLAVCVNQEPWTSYCVQPPCGQLNIANENMYTVLATVYEDLINLFDNLDLYHFGGDEIHLNCWNSSSEIVEWMATVGDGSLSEDNYYLQWSIFQEKSYQSFMNANGKVIPGIIWTSHLTEEGRADQFLDKDKYIIQIWTTGSDPIITELIEKEFRVIFSNSDAWYFDCGFGAWVGEGNNWCSPYIGWQIAYDNSPLDMAGPAASTGQVLGGEGALWSEQTDGSTMDAKLWPRAAAMAERLWSNPSSGWREAEYRMIHHRQRLADRGVNVERIQPEWCFQNAGLCYLDPVEPELSTTTIPEVTTTKTITTTQTSTTNSAMETFGSSVVIILVFALSFLFM